MTDDFHLLAEGFVSPATGQSLREVGTAGLSTSSGTAGFFPVVNRRLLFTNRASAGSGLAAHDASVQQAGRWLGGLLASKGGISPGAMVLELMPVDFSVAEGLRKSGGEVVGVLCPTDRDAPGAMAAAIVPLYSRMPAREGVFDGILMLDPRLWKTGIAALLAEAVRLLKPGGKLWMVAPVKGGPINEWIARFGRLGMMRGAVRGRIEQSLRPVSTDAATGLAAWLAIASRSVRKWDGLLSQQEFDALVAGAGLGKVRVVLAEIGLVEFEKPAALESAPPSVSEWRAPALGEPASPRDVGASPVTTVPPSSPRDLPVLVWDRERSAQFWRRVSGTDYLVSKAFSRICGDPLLDMLRKVLRKDWKYVDFGSGANGFIVEKMLARGLRCASSEPSRGADSPPYSFADHPLYLGEAASGRDGEFDCVLITEVVEHVHEEDFSGFMRRVRALVKPGGVAIVTTPNREDLKASSVFCPVSEVLFHPWQHLRSWTPEILESFLAGYGLAPLAVHQVDFTSMYPELERLRLLAGMAGWLRENPLSVTPQEHAALLEQMQALASDHGPFAYPALPARGREIHGYGCHLIYIGKFP